MIMPAYNILSKLVVGIVERVACAVELVFRELEGVWREGKTPPSQHTSAIISATT